MDKVYTLRDFIILARKERGLSQVQAAKLAGVSRTTYRTAETEPANLRYGKLMSILLLLDIKVIIDIPKYLEKKLNPF